jgi:thiosulfate/3-mercaptopyruvate sulfurtransferase
MLLLSPVKHMHIHPPHSPVISSTDLDQLGPVRILYVADGNEAPHGLTRVPVTDWIAHAKQTPSGLDDLAFWHGQISRLGIGPDALTVIADDGSMLEAARVWFILQYFGLPVVVLNGGLTALNELPRQAAPYAGPITLNPGSGAVMLMDRDGLKGALPEIQVFDARTAAEFSGADLKGNARGGHLPGASLLSHRDLLGDAGLKPVPQIAALMDKAGITDGKPIVTHCNGGGRAALAALAAVMAGKQDVRVYYLSFADWAADESCPVNLPE